MSDIVIDVKGKKYVVKTDRRYTETDEWALLEGGKVRIGITDYAQKELKDIVSVELPEVGRQVKKGEELGVIDSIKASSAYYAPVSGRVVEVNEELLSTPELVNKDPYGAGWIAVIEPSNPGEYEGLLDAGKYSEKIKSEKH
ncbi:glycine cleavage system protein GcvH [Desulfurococcus mucosus]|uniref:Probable glycine cleavage system H protein n=1 Tax=Desulfurococcus mucosus (strain ATCC 35584 / DSM 2162 / JCM 9187 / O7/1) TaxID=765177 RepID=E8R913_DESM0|nr:glycine cleavage system protein GcvH [Desulfurococcus mucosus]ADV64989.1 glycine cleavage system H protein [Desulfurococcus mucosus DSM 2162]